MATKGAIYRSKHSNKLVKVVATPDPFDPGDPDNQKVEFETLENGEWYGVFADNFHSGYDYVADSREDL